MRIVSIAARTIRWSIDSRGAARGRTERAAVVLEVRSDRGMVGLGEAAPLPGMSPDTLDDAEAAIAAFAQRAPFELADREAVYALAAASSGTGASDPARATSRTGATGLTGVTSRSASNLAEATSRTGASDHAATSSSTAATSTSAAVSPPATSVLAAAPHVATSHAAASASTTAAIPTPDRSMVATASPAARFAIETALLDALARDRGVPLSALLEAPAGGAPARAHVGALRSTPSRRPDTIVAKTVPLAAVVDDPDAARRAFAAGIRCLKIKLTASDDPDRVHAIAAAVPGARLRIDANRSWPRAEVVARLAVLAHLPIDYVEEPCAESHLLLSGSLPCKIALDESLVAITTDALHAALRSPMLAALVLKPTLLGGLSAVLALATLARRAGVAAIVSHGLEGPVGTAACAELALALGDDHPVGLATHPALDGWLVAVRQLAPDHVHSVAAGGLGFADLDLAGVVRACGPPQRTSSSRTPL